MKTEDAEVTSNEILLRLVWHHFFKRGPPIRVKLAAFHPKPLETDGISFFRFDCLADAQECLMAIPKAENRPLNGIVAVSVADVYQLGLSIVARHNSQVAGHVIAQELNIITWTNEKQIWLPVVERLAELSSSNILHLPNG